MREIKSICVYCGSQSGINEEYVAEARVLGEAMAKSGIDLIYGGGDRGIMGAVSSACRDNGGNVIGVIPGFLIGFGGESNFVNEEDRVIVTESMHERKQFMFEEADALIALPGGIGTLEEIIEVMTWAQLDQHKKPIGFLNTKGYWNSLIGLIEHMTEEGFMHNIERVQPIFIEKAEQAIAALSA